MKNKVCLLRGHHSFHKQKHTAECVFIKEWPWTVQFIAPTQASGLPGQTIKIEAEEKKTKYATSTFSSVVQ